MSMQVTVTLPDDIYRRAAYLAQLTGRDVSEVLAETINHSLHPLGLLDSIDRPVADLSDTEILAASNAQMDAAQDQRLSALLEKQQAGELSSEERTTLFALMQVYQDGLLRKAQALREAVRRGLRSPLAS